MGDSDTSFTEILQTKRILKGVLDFDKSFNDENDSLTVNRTGVKRSPETGSTSLATLAAKKCRCLNRQITPTSSLQSLTPLVKTKQATEEKQTSKESSDLSPEVKAENDKKAHEKRLETDAKIMKAVQLSEQDPDLIGDFSRPYALPVCKGNHRDLKTISPATLAALIRGEFSHLVNSHVIIDGRYPYEYEGGHIVGARNIYTKQNLLKELLDSMDAKLVTKSNKSLEDNENKEKDKNDENCTKSAKRQIIIFHCEFSSKRGPSLSRFLRNKDREYNTARYPVLYHPEIYLLEGGYKAFFEQFKELCAPQTYLPMLSKDHKDQLRQYRNKTKTFSSKKRK